MAKQLEMTGVSGWGGKRRGAGRPNLTGTVGHSKRVAVDFKKPLHITLKMRENLPNIRSKSVLKMFSACCERSKRFDFHVIHFTIQSDHIHLIVEAANNSALGCGMRSLAGTFSRRLRKIIQTWKGVGKIVGSVFKGRYHLERIGSPTQMRRTLRYVLLNSSKHEKLIEFFDPYCSGAAFSQWKELLKSNYTGLIKRQLDGLWTDPQKLGLSYPRSWLVKEGWKKAA